MNPTTYFRVAMVEACECGDDDPYCVELSVIIVRSLVGDEKILESEFIGRTDQPREPLDPLIEVASSFALNKRAATVTYPFTCGRTVDDQSQAEFDVGGATYR